MKRVLFLCLLLKSFSAFALSTDYDFSNYDFNLVRIINEGNGENEISVSMLSPEWDLPSCFSIFNNKIYIPDVDNRRTSVFDLSCNHIKNIDLCVLAKYIKINTDRDYIGYSRERLQIKNDEESFVIFSDYFPVDIEARSMISFPGILFAYTRFDREIVSIINPSGDKNECEDNFLDSEQTRALFENNDPVIPEGLTIGDKDRLFLDGELLTYHFRIFATYWSQNHENHWQNERNKYLPFASSATVFAGRDDDGNWYWFDFSDKILIFDNEGFVLDIIEVEQDKCFIIPAIHPNGDIYTLSYDTDAGEIYIWKIDRVW